MQIVVSEFQDQLLRGLTHRMNNILSLFHGYLGLLMDDKKVDPIARDGLAKIKEGARAASELMERTNCLVRPGSAIWREINLADLFRQMRPTFESFCPAKVKLEIRCPDDLPCLWADASRLRMALTELVRNACEAAKGKAIIEVSAVQGGTQPEWFPLVAEQPEHWLSIQITDDGAGIPPDLDERIYTPFYTTKRNQQSAGLGLTVAVCCAQQLHGALRHHSQPGETVFELVLPSKVVKEPAPAA